MMATFLTFVKSKSFHYNFHSYKNEELHPDENYAREIMQLFSIGLYELNLDGTRKVDSDGANIPTYTNEDIVSLARAWTGFDRQALRSNIEHVVGEVRMAGSQRKKHRDVLQLIDSRRFAPPPPFRAARFALRVAEVRQQHRPDADKGRLA